MSSHSWLSFLSSRLAAQINLENARRLRLWFLALVAAFSLGYALNSLGRFEDRSFLIGIKNFYLFIFHGVLISVYYLPAMLQKGEKPLARLLGVKDFLTLTVFSLAFAFSAYVTFLLAWQNVTVLESMGTSSVFILTAWINFFMAAVYFFGILFYGTSLFFFPSALVKLAERSGKWGAAGLLTHAILLLLQALTVSEISAFGSLVFFDQLRIAALFWIFTMAFVLFLGRILEESKVPALAALELDVASGKLNREEDILLRLKEAFALKRLLAWTNRISYQASAKTHEIARYAHDAVSLVDRENPTELDLRQVEDRYRKGEQVFKKLDKDHQRFLLSVSYFDLSDLERERVEALRDQFSRDLRNAKIELASIRKKIDEKLVALKNTQKLVSPPLAVSSQAAPAETLKS